jgi:hypothetical protein
MTKDYNKKFDGTQEKTIVATLNRTLREQVLMGILNKVTQRFDIKMYAGLLTATFLLIIAFTTPHPFNQELITAIAIMVASYTYRFTLKNK